MPHAEEPFARSGVVDDEMLLGMVAQPRHCNHRIQRLQPHVSAAGHAQVKLLLLNSALQLDTYSAVVALPGAPAGNWHSDVEDPFAFHTAIVGGRSHAPPPGLVVVVPLVDVDETLGPTAFRLGSHVKSEGGMWDRGEADNAAAFPELSLPARRGTVVLFDLRLEHRGGANRGVVKRPILYLGYTNRWYRDVSNFKESHSAAWSSLPSRTHRALYARLDSQEYVLRLERELEARGGDLAALKAPDAPVGSDEADQAHDLII